MKKSFFFLSIFATVLFLTQCRKKSEEKIEEQQSMDLTIVSQIRAATITDADGTIVVQNEEYFNDSRDVYGGTYSGVFFTGTGLNRTKTSAGSLMIGSVNVPWLNATDPDKSQYQKYMGNDQSEMGIVKNTYGTTIPIALSGSNIFTGLTTNVYMPKKMSVVCDGTAGGYLSKSNDLTLQWVPDNTTANSKVYILLAADNPGNVQNPAVSIIETEDDGLYVINSSTLQSFQLGGTAVLHCGRGRSVISSQGNKEVEIISVVEAKASLLEVTQ